MVEPAGQRWRYRHTWMSERPDHVEQDTKDINAHVDKWAQDGWELVSANAVQMLFIGAGGPYNSETVSSFFTRHYFYWRKRVSPDYD